MTDFDANEFMLSLNPEDAADGVDKAFAALTSRFSRADFESAVDAIERDFIADIRDAIKSQGAANLKKESRLSSKSDVPCAQMAAQVILHISRVKGDDASPFTKAFVRAAEKLTDEEYNSVACANKPLSAAIDAVAEELRANATKPNPFRRGSPPRPQ